MGTNKIYVQVAGLGGAVLSTFLADSIDKMLPWLVVMTALIMCDLIAGVCKAWKLGERVTINRAIRDTTAKACTYYSGVVFACFFQVATSDDTEWCEIAAKIFSAVEGVSILRNIFQWHGYNLDGKALLSMILHRIFGGNREDYNGVVKDKEFENKNKI
jgi:hypothetical protein